MAIEVFNRFEHKYIMTRDIFDEVRQIIDQHMEHDKYNVGGKLYTIANLYYDTQDNFLIRSSLAKPVYKEKLRLRSYGVPKSNDTSVFLEIKKKFNGIVNKRRTTLHLDEAYQFIQSGEIPEIKEYMNPQVLKELDYFLHHYTLKPRAYIAYDRFAYFENNNPDLRISFDTNVRTRRNDLALELGDYGTPLLDSDIWLMEIKTSKAKPLWVCEMLSKFELRKTSFSKYGTEYKRFIQPQNTAQREIIAQKQIQKQTIMQRSSQYQNYNQLKSLYA